MQISGVGQQFSVTSTVGGSTSTATFMTINNQASTCGASADYVICNGVVRDIVQQEAEWGGGITNCPNVYADIVLTLPANATYFTYQLSLMFLASQQARTISELCPISLFLLLGLWRQKTEQLRVAPLLPPAHKLSAPRQLGCITGANSPQALKAQA